MIILLGFSIFLSTLAGGLIGLRYRNKMHLILGFTAGVLLSVVAFDIFPEIIRLVGELKIPSFYPMVAFVVGFLLFHIFEKFLLIHNLQEEKYSEHKHPAVGVLSALAISIHSFFDGLGIGVGFQVSASVGILVAIAVISHNFSDGLNTVSLMLAHKNTKKAAFTFLLLVAMAPVLGLVSTLFLSLPEKILILYLGFFAGFLMYIGAADILPEAHSQRSSFGIIGMTILGVVVIFLISQVVG